MKHFQTIEKKWKSVEKRNCEGCGKPVKRENDYFVLTAHWKIKNKADEHHFCSIDCVKKWCKEDEDN